MNDSELIASSSFSQCFFQEFQEKVFSNIQQILKKNATKQLKKPLKQRFEQNNGQWKSNALYRMDIPNGQVQFLADKVSFGGIYNTSNKTEQGYVWNLRFEGTNKETTRIEGKKRSIGGLKHYTSETACQVYTTPYQELWYYDIYHLTDLRFYETEQQELEYDFILHPGANLQHIRLQTEGIKHKFIDKKTGELVLESPVKTFRQSAPYTYQVINGKQIEVPSAYTLNQDGTISFVMKATYRTDLPLIIDPKILKWSTYLGGAAADKITDVVVDDNGFVYTVGHSSSSNFPTTAGAVSNALNGNNNWVVSKLSADGSTLLWSTYIPVNQGSNSNINIALTSDNKIAVTGTIQGDDFPASSNAIKFNRTGFTDSGLAILDDNGNLTYSTYLGGSGFEFYSDVATDANGNIFVTLYTSSTNAMVSPNAYQTIAGGGFGDVYIASFTSTGTFLNATYIGGTGYEDVSKIAINPDGEVVVFAKTNGADFPTTADAYNSNSNTSSKVVVAVLSSDLTTLKHSSMFGNAAATATQFNINKQTATVGIDGNYYFSVAMGGTPNASEEGVYGMWKLDKDDFSNLTFVKPGFEVFSQDDTGIFYGSNNTEPFTADAPFTSGSTRYLTLYDSEYNPVFNSYLGATTSDATVINHIVGKDCKVYVVGETEANEIPISPGVYDETSNGSTDGFVMMWEEIYPTTNTLTDYPGGTVFCVNGAIDPIDGNDVTTSFPAIDDLILYGQTVTYPLNSFAINYQWQVSTTSSTGPWTDIAGATTEDFIPNYNAAAGSRWYRRTATSVGACAQTLESNAIEVVIDNRIAHQTNAGGTFPICSNVSTVIGAAMTVSLDGTFAPYSYNWTPTTNLTGTTSGTITDPATDIPSVTVTTDVDAVYTLEITDSRGCKSTDQAIITVVQANAGDDLSTCGAASLVIGPSGPANPDITTYAWTPAGSLDDASLRNPTVTSLPAFGASETYTLTVNGCPDTDFMVVTNTNGITAPTTFSSQFLCEGDTVTLGDAYMADPSLTYQWTPLLNIVDGQDPNTQFIGAYAAAPVNEIDYILTITDPATGCSDTVSQRVTLYDTPQADFEVKMGWCPGTGDATLGIVEVEPGMDYTWTAIVDDLGNTGNGIPTNAEALAFLDATNTPQVQVSMTGPAIPNGGWADVCYDLYYIRETANAANNTCARQDTVLISYCPTCGDGLCALDFAAGQTGFCGGANTIIGPLTVYSGYTYTYSPVTGLTDPSTNLPLVDGEAHPAEVYANPGATTTYTLTVQSANYPSLVCDVDIPVFVGVSTDIALTFTNTTICPGDSIEIGGPTIAGLTYEWSPMEGLDNPILSNPKAYPTTSTEYMVTVTDPASACSTTETVQVNVNDPIVDAGDNRDFCASAGLIVDIGTPAILGYTYNWISPVTGLYNTNQAQTSDTIYVTTTYILEVTAPSGCIVIDSVTYTAVDPIVADAGSDLNSCDGNSITLGLPALAGNYTYLWTSASPGNGLPAGGSTDAQPTVTTTGAGPWDYTLTITQAGAVLGDPSCSAIDNISVTTLSPPTVDLNPAAPCASTGVEIGPSDDPTGFSYVWTPFPLTGLVSGTPITKNIFVYPSTATTYTLTARHDVSGCVYTYDVMVPAPTYTAELSNNLTVCKGDSDPTISLSTVPPGGATITWTGGSGDITESPAALLDISDPVNPIFDLSTATSNTTYTYRVSVDYGGGCVSEDEISITVEGSDAGLAGLDQSICPEECVTLGLATITGYTYNWTTVPFDAIKLVMVSDVSIAQPTACVTETTTFELTYSDASGTCVGTDYVTISVPVAAPDLVVRDSSFCPSITGTYTIDLASTIVSNNGTTTTYWLDVAATYNPVAAPTQVYAGTYYIKSDNGICADIDTVVITQETVPTYIANIGLDCAASTGFIALSNFMPTWRYDFSMGSTYTGIATYATATPIPTSGQVATNLPYTSSSQDYTIRVFEADGCYVDKTVSLSFDDCPCTVPTLTANTTNPTTCSGTDGTIQITGMAASTAYILNFMKDGVAQTAQNITSDGSGNYVITGLDAAAYTAINVTAAGCTSNDVMATLTDPTSGTAMTTPTAETCALNDGSIQITITGGSSPFDFSWDDSNGNSGNSLNEPSPFSISNLPAGMYSITVLDNIGCSITTSETVTAPSGCCASITNPTAAQNICEGQNIATLQVNTDASSSIDFVYFSAAQTGNSMYSGGISLGVATPSGGTASISNVSFPASGVYYVYAILSPTPADGTCRPFQEIIVTVNANPSDALAVSDPQICSGDEVSIEIMNSETGVSYQLRLDSDDSNVGSPLAGNGGTITFMVSSLTAGSYTYNVLATNTSAGCAAELTDKAIVQVDDCDFPDYNFGGFLPTCASPPCHIVGSDIYLGSGVTNDPPTNGDTNADSDMDDGVSFPNNIRPNITIRVPVTIFNNTGNDAYLSAWVDWNGDGDFDDTGEQIAAANAYPFASNNGTFNTFLSVTVPADAVQGQDIGVRFRLSSLSTAIASPCGASVCAADGEVEDYLIQVECPPAICLPPTIQINRN